MTEPLDAVCDRPQSTAERGPSLPRHEWAKHKATILDLYIKQSNTLKQVMKYMEAQGFKARLVNTSEAYRPLN